MEDEGDDNALSLQVTSCNYFQYYCTCLVLRFLSLLREQIMMPSFDDTNVKPCDWKGNMRVSNGPLDYLRLLVELAGDPWS